MPDVRDLYPEVALMDGPQLRLRYEALKAQCHGDPSRMDDDEKLREMVVILGEMRKKSAGPPKAKAKATKDIPSVGDLL